MSSSINNRFYKISYSDCCQSVSLSKSDISFQVTIQNSAWDVGASKLRVVNSIKFNDREEVSLSTVYVFDLVPIVFRNS